MNGSVVAVDLIMISTRMSAKIRTALPIGNLDDIGSVPGAMGGLMITNKSVNIVAVIAEK